MIHHVLYWLGQRMRDFLMWPINLLRDFPIRFGPRPAAPRKGKREPVRDREYSAAVQDPR
mgnify:CR=1 FL=1